MSTTSVNTSVSASAQSETADDIDIRGSARAVYYSHDPYDEIYYCYNIIDIFIHSGLHAKWPNKPKYIIDVYAIAEIKLPGAANIIIMAKNDRGRYHAEENLINKLRRHLESTSPRGGRRPIVDVTVKIWINFSPCYRCSRRILNFIEEMRRRNIYMSVEIVFPCLYRIRRNYCEDNCYPHQHNLPSQQDHDSNVKGLLNLKHDGGVFLKVFNDEEWRKLQEVLRINYGVPENRRLEDETLELDFLRMIRPQS